MGAEKRTATWRMFLMVPWGENTCTRAEAAARAALAKNNAPNSKVAEIMKRGMENF